MWYLSAANGCSTVDRRNRIISGVARCCIRCNASSCRSGDQASLPLGTAILQDTCAADFRLCCIVHSAIFARDLFAPERLLCRATESVGLLVVMELRAVEQCAVSLIVRRPIGGHVGHDPSGLTGFSLLAVGVTGVGHHV